MALIPQTDAPLTDVAGISDNALSHPVAVIGSGALVGAGLGLCLGLAPRSTLGLAAAVAGFAAAGNHDRLRDWSANRRPSAG